MDCTIYAACKSMISGGKNSPDNFYFNGTTLKKDNRGNREILDSKFNTRSEACFGLFEGMGKAGNQASYLSAKLLGHFLEKKSPSVTKYYDMLRSFAMSSSRVVYNELAGYSSYSSLGVCYFKNDGLYVISNATTKIYIQREASLKELSIENESYLGQLPIQPEPLALYGRLEIGDRVVICTNAVSENISSDYFNEILSVEDNASSCVERLLAEAVSQNIGTPASVMVFDVLDADGIPDSTLPDFFDPDYAIVPPGTPGSSRSSDRSYAAGGAGAPKKSMSGIISIVSLILFAVAVVIVILTTMSNPGKGGDDTESSTGMYNFDTNNTALPDDETTRKKDKEKSDSASKSESSSSSSSDSSKNKDNNSNKNSSSSETRGEKETTKKAETTTRKEETTTKKAETTTQTTSATTKETTSREPEDVKTTNEPQQTEPRNDDQTEEPIYNPPDDDDNDDEED